MEETASTDANTLNKNPVGSFVKPRKVKIENNDYLIINMHLFTRQLTPQ